MSRRLVRDWKVAAFAILTAAVLVICLVIDGLTPARYDFSLKSRLVIDESDTRYNWNRLPEFNIDLSETVTIKKSGTYNIYGELSDGQIIVDVGDASGKAKLVLHGVRVKSSVGPAIYVKSADDVVIETAQGTENFLEDGEYYSMDDEKINGAIYSLGDLTLQGDGKLSVTGNYQDGIVSKDDLNIRSGEIDITAKDDAIRGKDSVHITGGVMSIRSGKDGIKSTNTDTDGKGFVYIEGGEMKIDAGDDGISASNVVMIDGGKIDIEHAYEGIESNTVEINGGNIYISSQDDGINVAESKDEYGFSKPYGTDGSDEFYLKLIINDGDIYINSSGDGLDSNGKIVINGGDLEINAAVEALDATIEVERNGGNVILQDRDNVV